MPLFKSIEDLKAVVGAVNLNNSETKMEPFVEAALDEFVAPIISRELVDHLIETYMDADDSNEVRNKAILMLQKSAANLSYMLLASDGGIEVTDQGMFRPEDSAVKSAWQWQTMDFRKAREQQGFSALRNLYLFLEKNTIEPFLQDYLDSPERTRMNSFFIQDDQTFNSFVSISGFQTWLSLRSFQTKIQAETLQEILTEELYNELSAISKVNLTEEKELITICQRVVASGTILAAIPLLPFKFSNDGLIVSEFISNKDNAKQETQAIERTRNLQASCSVEFAKAKEDLVKYLDKNASSSQYESYYTEVVLPRIETETSLSQLREKRKEGGVKMI